MQLQPRKGVGVMGLGKMGSGIAEHLDKQGYTVVGYDPDEQSREELNLQNGTTVSTARDLASGLPSPRVIWMMVPHGVVDQALNSLAESLTSGDVIIDAGNSDFRETVKRSERLSDQNIHLVDAGVSGGPSGARNGAAIMVGGDTEVVGELSGLFADLSVKNGFQHMGAVGSGHFTKMIHNGIEYGILQAIAEGVELLKEGPHDIDLKQATQAYGSGSVIESQLIEHLQSALDEFGTDLEGVSARVASGGTGDWTLETARKHDTTHKAIAAAVSFRHESDDNPVFAGKVIQALRNQFGGHPVNPDTD